MEPTGDTVVALGTVPVVILWYHCSHQEIRTRVLLGGIRATVEPPGDTVVETGYLGAIKRYCSDTRVRWSHQEIF